MLRNACASYCASSRSIVRTGCAPSARLDLQTTDAADACVRAAPGHRSDSPCGRPTAAPAAHQSMGPNFIERYEVLLAANVVSRDSGQVLCMRIKLRLPGMSGPDSCGWRCAQCPPQCMRLRSMMQLPPAGRQAWPQTAKDMLAAVVAPYQTCVDIGSVWSLHQRLIETVHGHGS
jgi:hypothetical protein